MSRRLLMNSGSQIMLFAGMLSWGILTAPMATGPVCGQEPVAEAAPEESTPVESTPAEPPAADETPGPAANNTEESTAEETAAETDPPAETDALEDAESQDTGDDRVGTPETPTPDSSTKADAFAVELRAWKDLIKEMRDLWTEYGQAEDDQLAALEQAFEAKKQQGNEMLSRMRTAAVEAYQERPNVDRELSKFMIQLLIDDIRADDYEAGQEISQLLLDNENNEPEVANLAGIVAFATNDYKLAKTQLEKANESGTLTDQGQSFISVVDEYQQLWAEEKKLRDAEAEADDLPRVKLTTSEGDVVIELLENEAPGAVGNFINLVENGFYNDLLFHRVIPGFMAQGGDPNGDGSGGPGYNIYCECTGKEHRRHFRGSLSMAHAGRDTGGSQFFLTFVPTPHLNGKHTVFGRVIEGTDVLARIERGDPENPPQKGFSRIVSAEVIRKRDHDYLPNKVK